MIALTSEVRPTGTVFSAPRLGGKHFGIRTSASQHTIDDPAIAPTPHNESLVTPTRVPAIQRRSVPLPHACHTMRRNKNASVDIDLFLDSTA